MNGYRYLGMYPGLAVCCPAPHYHNPVQHCCPDKHDPLMPVVRKINQPEGAKHAQAQS